MFPATNGDIVSRRPDQLRPHPSYILHHLTVPTSKLSALIERGDLAFREPLVITREGIVIDGYARLEAARLQGRLSVRCIEYPLTEAEALQWLLQSHLRSAGLNAFSRILLALELESWFQEKARSNQQAGGQLKGSSKLTQAEKIDVRKEIAAAAGASVGNVSKVKRLIATAHAQILDSLRSGDVSIHLAWQWSRTSPEEQRLALRRHRAKQGINRAIRVLVSQHSPKLGATPIDINSLVKYLAALERNQLVSVTVQVVKSPGKSIYVTEELSRALGLQQIGLCETNSR